MEPPSTAPPAPPKPDSTAASGRSGARPEDSRAGGPYKEPVETAAADKAHVIRVLREIAVLLQVKGENSFKSRAYEIAADRIAGSQEDLATLVRDNRLQEIPGIGSALSEKISQLVRTGRLDYYEKLKAEYPPGITELMKVPDLGPKKAALLWEKLGIGDVDGLERACKAQQLRGLKGFGEKSESKILAGIEV